MAEKSWIRVQGAAAPQLEYEVGDAVRMKLEARCYSQEELHHVATFDAYPLSGPIDASPEEIDLLRRLCSHWYIKLQPSIVTSHRRFSGWAIVRVKRLLFRMLEGLLAGALREQREFNAAAIALFAARMRAKDRASPPQ